MLRPTALADAALVALAREPWYSGQIAHIEVEPQIASRHREPAEALDPPLSRYLDHGGISLYTHQAEALDHWREGRDVVIATRTASGKSLAFNLCAAEALLADKAATALYLYPTKALANDQIGRLAAFDTAVGLRTKPATYDGDTPLSQRARIRRESRIIASNPYGLHEYLAQPAAFQAFWANLAIVVIDEAHRYRGVFGTHVAFVIRRLLRVAERFGAHPRFLLASGTIANPGDHGSQLIGRPVVVVDDDGAPRGPRTVALWDSMADPGSASSTQTARILASLMKAGRATICFTGSRVATELIAQWAADMAPGHRVSPYRAGYRPAERREIEDLLRAGKLNAVVSTDALELGIDIGGLDAAVLAGYPGTIASTWQQIGRAGRAQQPSLGIVVAGDDPLDQFLVRRPDTIFGAPVERAVVALQNPEILSGQVMCAAAETAVRDDEALRFGPGLPEAIAGLEAARLLAPTRTGHIFSGTFRPVGTVRIDGRNDESIEVRVGDEIIEILDGFRALREVHTGAVLMHRGQKYKIAELDLGAGTAHAQPIRGDEHTRSTVVRDFELGETDDSHAAGCWQMSLGYVKVRSRVVGFKTMERDEVIAVHQLDLPPIELDTRGLWMSPLRPLHTLLAPGRDLLGSLHAAEHALIHAMPLLAMCDRGDAGGISTLTGPGNSEPLMLLHDAYEGGSGTVDEAFHSFRVLAGLTLEMIESCDCGSAGCHRCCYSRLCGSDNEPMDRLGAIHLLKSLLDDPPDGSINHRLEGPPGRPTERG
ncbi:MAG: DEAD/DEAH box helicase [Acidimicrobiales bacterium]